MHVIRLVAAVAAAASIAAVVALPITASAASASSTPNVVPTRLTDYTAGGVPEFGMVGQGIWQVAGLVNMGEPTMRIVYDQTVPGARERALSDMYALESSYPTLQQPGVTSGLREVGYSAHYDGVQFQVWGDNPYIDNQVSAAMTSAGLPLIAA